MLRDANASRPASNVTTPPLLCEHPLDGAARRGHRLQCRQCGSFWDLDSRQSQVAYDASYPVKRGHFDPWVGALKVRSLKAWLRVTDLTLAGKHVCEAGFGGGTCLPFLTETARKVTGIEANESAIDRV